MVGTIHSPKNTPSNTPTRVWAPNRPTNRYIRKTTKAAIGIPVSGRRDHSPIFSENGVRAGGETD